MSLNIFVSQRHIQTLQIRNTERECMQEDLHRLERKFLPDAAALLHVFFFQQKNTKKNNKKTTNICCWESTKT